MTQKQMIELVQQHHPDMGQAEARIHLNHALKDFSAKSRILRKTYRNTVASNTETGNARVFYAFDGLVQLGSPSVSDGERILEIERVDYDGYEIPRITDGHEQLITDGEGGEIW
tara:strand:+ start:354 stop:695 length:342 start_codon:yes stop_codon:yes gene_type:complete